QANERDVAAEDRDARARAFAEAVAADPDAHPPAEVSAFAAADRAAAAADRDSAAEDRDTLLRLLLGEGERPSAARPLGLTGRETQVLERLARAMTTKAIADDLFLSPNSVKTHTQSVFRKIGVKSRSEAALWARDHGIG
ncbi:MAG TPA: LuxR C-terminal-related transcriptional regulator, partial [Iamia sp.]|nr:LuxR C-terminal-related transcriptional regulator [Iamia sp.]